MEFFTKKEMNNRMAQVTGYSGGDVVIMAVCRQNSRIEIALPGGNPVKMTVNDWCEFANEVNSAINFIEYHFGRHREGS